MWQVNKRGDVLRYIIWFIVLLIFLIIALVLFYSSSIKLIKKIWEEHIFG